ncbi:DUF2252 domain-containing protein [Salinibacterium sp. ZJ450]|uniref:DUF2252 domain-containing protein n=1 Tax=Salinibacterium sp. ZJ450 TaxID=2708338 RepID=UPI001CD1D4D0|nr:DUF2252 domain-containing protein [Salinibacterium sp. ZJ450]
MDLLEEQAVSRVPDLVPIRYGRMMVSPFTFYRGAALLMASDLASQPHTGLRVQLCGDAHLSNFGVFGTPERALVFDINDFDETLPGPFEWDVKRLAASFEIMARERKFSDKTRRAVVKACVRGYRQQMRKAAKANVLDSWYERIDSDEMMRRIRDQRTSDGLVAGRASAALDKARTRDSLHATAKLVHEVDGQLRIVGDPPLIVPVEDLLTPGGPFEHIEETMTDLLNSYRSTLSRQKHPVEDFTYVHMARKVVGVGSVGTRAWIMLLVGRNNYDPLLLQAKEAQESVLERFLEPSEFANHGERVVRGQRLMQAASDIFLGWQRVASALDGTERDFYLRQLHDWKGSVDVDTIQKPGALLYAQLCGETLARAHARTGDRVQIAGYMGKGKGFDKAIAAYAEAYADQNAADFAAFTEAVRSGRLRAQQGA